jgi:MoaA/NifB/PqqE/SkfB family radical SAM enzyme
MKEIIADLSQMGVKAVTLSGGGEPLFYPYIFETIDALTSAGIKVAVLTNGSLLKGRVAEILSEKATWVRISMDAADADNYSKIRKVNLKEFDKVCSNIYEFAKKQKKRYQLGINFIVMRENYEDVYKFLKLMKKLGVNHVKISESVMSVDTEENRKYHFSIIKSVKFQIGTAIKDLCDGSFSIIDKIKDFNRKDDSFNKGYSWCPFIQCLTVIGADLNVYTCQDKAYTKKGSLGTLKGKSFKDFWFSDKNRKKLLALNPRRDCNHHCIQNVKNLMLLEYFGLDKEHLDFV